MITVEDVGFYDELTRVSNDVYRETLNGRPAYVILPDWFKREMIDDLLHTHGMTPDEIVRRYPGWCLEVLTVLRCYDFSEES